MTNRFELGAHSIYPKMAKVNRLLGAVSEKELALAERTLKD